MKVLDLRCTQGHGFEGWFGSDEDFRSQNDRGLITCPVCNDAVVRRMPSAPRLNLSGARAAQADAAPPAGVPATVASPLPEALQPAGLQAAWLATVRHLLNSTEDVGGRFAEEVRRIHYGETPHRGIRGQATREEREALLDEGIETLAIPVPCGLEGPLQ